jgi:hypothetical protein
MPLNVRRCNLVAISNEDMAGKDDVCHPVFLIFVNKKAAPVLGGPRGHPVNVHD